MSRLVSVFAVVCLASASGCAAFNRDPVDARIASQVYVSKSDPQPGCTFVGQVQGATTFGELSDAHADVLRNAVLSGGNWVAVDLVERPVVVGVGGYVVRGRLFACPSAGPTAPATSPFATTPPASIPAGGMKRADCDPPCATGFACTFGACLAAPAPRAAVSGN